MRVYGQFNTGFNTNVKVERSTAVTYPAAWLFVRTSGTTGPVKGGLHLSLTDAKALRATLDAFIGDDR